MKKFLILAAVAAATMVLFSACEKEKKAAPAAETTTVTDNKTVGHYPDPLWPIVPGKLGAAAAPVVVENVISTDRQAMYLQYAKDYNFFESCITLKDFLDDEACDGTVESVANVFQFVVVKESKSADVNVVLFAHAGGKDVTEVKHGFWTEDLPLEETAVKLTFKEAFDRMMKANIVKPHSRQCVLRRPLGPKVCNAQYVFGNRKQQVWVDAVTGDVASTNPAFGGMALGTPLGEWP